MNQPDSLQLWDRATEVPTLTSQGKIMVASARRLCTEADELARVAHGLVGGLEAELSLALDALLPVRALVELTRSSPRRSPNAFRYKKLTRQCGTVRLSGQK